MLNQILQLNENDKLNLSANHSVPRTLDNDDSESYLRFGDGQ